MPRFIFAKVKINMGREVGLRSVRVDRTSHDRSIERACETPILYRLIILTWTYYVLSWSWGWMDHLLNRRRGSFRPLLSASIPCFLRLICRTTRKVRVNSSPFLRQDGSAEWRLQVWASLQHLRASLCTPLC
jgi:hypothetical protein